MNPNRRQVTELALLIASVLAYPNAAAAGDPCVEATAKLNAFDRSYDSQMDDLRQQCVRRNQVIPYGVSRS